MTDITPGNVTRAMGFAINSKGEVAGSIDGHPFLYSNGVLKDLDTTGAIYEEEVVLK